MKQAELSLTPFVYDKSLPLLLGYNIDLGRERAGLLLGLAPAEVSGALVVAAPASRHDTRAMIFFFFGKCVPYSLSLCDLRDVQAGRVPHWQPEAARPRSSGQSHGRRVSPPHRVNADVRNPQHLWKSCNPC